MKALRAEELKGKATGRNTRLNLKSWRFDDTYDFACGQILEFLHRTGRPLDPQRFDRRSVTQPEVCSQAIPAESIAG